MMEHNSIWRERKQKEKIGNFGANKRHSRSDNGDKLANDVLINILSRLSLKGAARTSVLTRRWRSLWRFSHGTLLLFDQRDNTSSGYSTRCKEFESWVYTVLDLHQDQHIEGIVVNFDAGVRLTGKVSHEMSYAVHDLVYFASRKDIQLLQVKLSIINGYELKTHGNRYEFPSLGSLISHSNGVITSPFRRLRTLKLVHVGIKDNVVHYFLAWSLYLEELCIQYSYLTRNLRIVDPPSLRVLEISRCYSIQSLEISAMNLVSLTYGGEKSSLVMKSIPNVCELTIVDDLCVSFVRKPNEHSSYSVQLETLVLDFRKLEYVHKRIVARPDLPQLGSLKRLVVKVFTLVGQTLLFTSLIKGSPHLREFRIELSYSRYGQNDVRPAFPGMISKVENFVHRNLKVVEMVGYIGCRCAEELLLELTSRCPSLERVVIDTHSDYYDEELDPYIERRRRKKLKYGRSQKSAVIARNKAKMRAKRFVSNIPKSIKLIVS